jgi:hypothetical protein
LTTIAVNNKSIACDLQFTHSSGIKFKGATKIIELKQELSQKMFEVNKAFVGFCGNADIWGDIVSWFAIPEGKMPKCRGIEMLMLTDKGKIYHGTTLTNWTLVDVKHFSVGTGSHLAMGAMELGQTPGEAIKLAAKFDPMTGMGVKEYYINKS